MVDVNLIKVLAKKNGLKAKDIDDLIQSICIKERLSDGRSRLNIGQVIKSGYGYSLSDSYRVSDKPLPAIQEKRLACDILYVITGGKIEGTNLTMPTTASLVNKHISDYEDSIEVCDKYLDLYKESVQESISIDGFIDLVIGVASRYKLSGLVIYNKYSSKHKEIGYSSDNVDYKIAIADHLINTRLEVKDKLYLALDIIYRAKQFGIDSKQKLVLSQKTISYIRSYKEVYEALSRYFILAAEKQGIEESVLTLAKILYGGI